MPQSMTGFANQTVTVGDWNLSIECKSVNSRFLDLTLKLPDVLKRSEPQYRKIVSDRIVRGKVELAIRLERADPLPRRWVFRGLGKGSSSLTLHARM